MIHRWVRAWLGAQGAGGEIQSQGARSKVIDREQEIKKLSKQPQIWRKCRKPKGRRSKIQKKEDRRAGRRGRKSSASPGLFYKHLCHPLIH